MARKHVFPVSLKGSKIYTAKDKKVGGKSLALGTFLFSETEDPDIVFTERTSTGTYTPQYLFLSGDKTEYLIDHTDAPPTDLVVGVGQEYVIPIFPFMEGGGVESLKSTPVKLHEDLIGKPVRITDIPPGQVVCIARKKNSNAAWSSTTVLSAVLYFLFSDPRNTAPFNDQDAEFISNGFNGAKLADGQWATYMWTGTRFVFLGSNNWY